jgi:hypothetical protein
MTRSALPPHESSPFGTPAKHPLLSLAAQHLQWATEGLMTGRFNAIRELRDPTQMLVVYRKRYGGDVVGDEYLVAEPTYIQGPRGSALRAGETVVFDFTGTPAVAVVEALLYRKLLQHDPDGQALVARHLAHHLSPTG